MNSKYLFLVPVGLLVVAPALSYVGPGAGLTLLSALWGLVVALLLAVGFVLWWPIRRWRRRQTMRREGAPMDDMAAPEVAEASAPEREPRREVSGRRR